MKGSGRTSLHIEGARQPDLANAHWLEAVQSRGWS
jgi:hypothetical protein